MSTGSTADSTITTGTSTGMSQPMAKGTNQTDIDSSTPGRPDRAVGGDGHAAPSDQAATDTGVKNPPNERLSG